MSEFNQYAERDLMAMDIAGNHYCRHVDHMTRENLHRKSDIAAELGWRDMQIAALKAERDALAAENVLMLKLLTDISENHVEYFSENEGYTFAGVPLDYVSEINTYISRDVNAENPFPATDAYANQLRAEGVMLLHKEQKEVALKNWQYDNFDALKRAAIRHCDEELIALICMLDQMEGFAANLRKENGND